MNKEVKRIGDSFFYEAFYSGKTAIAIKNGTSEALSPYISFLENAIKSQQKRGNYEIKFEIIRDNYQLKIEPIYSKFKIKKPKSILKILLDSIDNLKEERNKLFFDTQDKILRFNKNELKIEGDILYFENLEVMPKLNEKLEFNNQEIEYEIEDIELKKGDKLFFNDKEYEIFEIEEINDGWNVKLETNQNIKILSFRNYKLDVEKYPHLIEELFDSDGKFNFEKIDNGTFACKVLPKSKILKDIHNNEYKWQEIQNNSHSKRIIVQLIDEDTNDNEKLISDYFFEDDTTEVYQEKGKLFKIEKKMSEDKILVLQRPFKDNYELKEDKPIKIKVNIQNLKRAQSAIKSLNSKPVKEQKNLIKLFEKKREKLWDKPKIQQIDDWFILKDEDFDGTIEQRDFVKKAIATKDFAILEGPPGSGKTTTILELILQLIKRGQKILLTASTHVAIDNVLERIKSFNDVEAIRIGKEGSISDEVIEFQIDKKIEEYKQKGFNEKLAKQLLVDGANLVCGTTMGITQYPLIKDQDNILPIEPIFDVMIIDEASKTTFYEFIVPALYAKKWILVGDIKQLSPYIEQSHIITNLEHAINRDDQEAVRIVFETLYNNKLNPYIVEVSDNVETKIREYLFGYWAKKNDNPYKDKVISFFDEPDLLKLLGSDLILIKEGSWERVKNRMPRTHIVKLKNDIENDSFYFEQLYLNKKKKLPKYKKINKNYNRENNPIDYKMFFKELFQKSWAEEIAWRMIRVYERRMLKERNSHYEKGYELLQPITDEVNRIYNMSLPSILESIQVGNGEDHKHKTTITDGFDKRDLKLRHTILKIQHRMHPDISQFSRKEFYTNSEEEALVDSKKIDRDWSYDRYPKHSVWIDTPKKEKQQNDRIHKKEVAIIIREIKEFIKFAKNNPGKNMNIAILTFYRPQESLIREELRKLCNQPRKMSRFTKEGVNIMLYTVDKFQGMEADIVFLSMVRGKSVGFMDNINRLNVALTRAKYQRVIIGDKEFFKRQKDSEELSRLAREEFKYEN